MPDCTTLCNRSSSTSTSGRTDDSGGSDLRTPRSNRSRRSSPGFWRESLDSWHLWNFDQEAFDVIQAADNAYQQRLALVETTGVVLPQGAPSQDQAAASGAAGASSSAADWLRPPTPPSASSWLQDSRTPWPRIRPSAEERQAAKSTLRGVYAKAAETRRESSRERSTQRSRSPSPRRSRSPSTSPRRGPTAAAPVEQRAHSVEPALAREGRPSRTSFWLHRIASTL